MKIDAGEQAANRLREHVRYMQRLHALDDDLSRRIAIGRKALKEDDFYLWDKQLEN